MNTPKDYFFTKEHEWAAIEGSKAKIGISDYAQHKLGDITYIDLPKTGKSVKQFDVLTGIESVKAASDIYSPLSGKVISVNNSLEDAPEIVNQSPYEKGWIAELEITDPSETSKLMSSDDYEKYISGLEK